MFRPRARLLLIVPFVAVVTISGCNKDKPKQEGAGPTPGTREAADASQGTQPTRSASDATQAGPGTVPDGPSEVAPMKWEQVRWKVTKKVSIDCDGPGSGFMRENDHGEVVLEGFRENPGRYRMRGSVKVIAESLETGQVVGTSAFDVVRLIPGKTERLGDCYVLCQGSFWVPALTPPDEKVDWSSVPATHAQLAIPTGGLGCLFISENGTGAHTGSSADGYLVFSADLCPMFWGTASVYRWTAPDPTPAAQEFGGER
jgi:hypothetical protein